MRRRTPYLKITFRGRPIRTSRKLQRSRNIYATALVRTMLENAQLVLGVRRCSRTIATITGVCNNPHIQTAGITNALQLHPWKGPVLSLSADLPNPRTVSNTLCKTTSEKLAPNKINFLLIVFGQFIDHDIALTPSGDTSNTDASFRMPENDPGQGTMHFLRSDPLPLLPEECCNKPYKPDSGEKRQFNRITSFIDGSAIYGSDYERSMALRRFKNGKLILVKDNNEEMLPRNSKRILHYTVENANKHRNTHLFVSGDIRTNENPFLAAMHTLFAREHNRICDELIQALRRRWKARQTDEWLYQQARRIVIAEIQNIVYHEFLPAVLGNNTLKQYNGYNLRADASMDILFSTVAYRWGHTTIPDTVQTRTLKNETKSHRLQDLFFNPSKFAELDIESWLLGAMHQTPLAVDLEVADSVRDFLFNPDRRAVLDLTALNIQRGRDHLLPSYTAALKAYGVKSNGHALGNIPMSLRTKIQEVYSSPNKIDVFIGGLAETPVHGSLLGPLFHTVVIDQFERLRDGDRFYYENIQWGRFMTTLPIVRKIKSHNVRLRDIIQANTRIRDQHMPNPGRAMRTA